MRDRRAVLGCILALAACGGDVTPADGGVDAGADACTPRARAYCGPDDGTLDLSAIGYQRAWVTTSSGFSTSISLTLGTAAGLGCDQPQHEGQSWVEPEAWVGTHEIALSTPDGDRAIAATLRIDEMTWPADLGMTGSLRGGLELRPEGGAPITFDPVTLPICGSFPSF